MSRPTIHLVFTVPLGANIIRRGIDKVIRLAHLTPLHRWGNDSLIPWQKPIRSVHAITYHLLHAFKALGYPVRLYSLYEHTVCQMKSGDIFIGLPLPVAGFGETRSGTDDRSSVTSRTIREYPHHRNFIIMPYTHDPLYVNWTKDLVRANARQGGGAIFIGGDIWKRNWGKSPYADITFVKKEHVMMGIDPRDYPPVKKSFNPRGQRKYLYIGHTAWYKNTKELENLATSLPNFSGAHLGEGKIKGWDNLGFASLTPPFVSKLAKEYDIFINVSTADPQATTILEQMCFGFVVACTPETGYEYPSLVKLSTDNTAANIRILQTLQFADEKELLVLTSQNRKIAETEHTWKKFCATVLNFMNVT